LGIFVVDHTDLAFDGASISQHEDPLPGALGLPFEIEYHSPGDFGSITIRHLRSREMLFDASIVWNGLGKIDYPTDWMDPRRFDLAPTPASMPERIDWIRNGRMERVAVDDLLRSGEEAESRVEAAWEAIAGLDLVGWFLEHDCRVGAYHYGPRQGMYDPEPAKWIFFLYAGARLQ
jgi:hypothetical protein